MTEQDTVKHSSIHSAAEQFTTDCGPTTHRQRKKQSYSQPGAIQVIHNVPMNCGRKPHYLWESHM